MRSGMKIPLADRAGRSRERGAPSPAGAGVQVKLLPGGELHLLEAGGEEHPFDVGEAEPEVDLVRAGAVALGPVPGFDLPPALVVLDAPVVGEDDPAAGAQDAEIGRAHV